MKTLNLTIRPFEKSDYASIAEVLNATWPDELLKEASLREEDTKHDPKVKWGRFVAELDAQVVGVASYTQPEGMYHPQKFTAWVTVRPEFRGQGIGKALYTRVLEALRPHEPISLLTTTREDQGSALAWLEKLGYVEKMRYWESRLDVTAFDPAPFAHAEAKARAHGIVITTLAELEQRDPDYKQKFYDLFCEAREDVPRPEPMTSISFEQWHRWTFESPYLLPEGNILAVDPSTGQYVGMSQLWKSDGDYLQTGLTGVRRAYRRKGLALAMKLRAVLWAKQVGCREIRTFNESNNRAMLSINEAMGFVKQPAWIDFVKVLREG